MKKILLLIVMTFSVTGYCQWTYSTGKSDFDGNYRTSSVYGSGGKFPYTKPYLVINKFENNSVNIYFSGAGYSGCDGRKIFFKFNDDDDVYETSYVGNGTNNDTWFVTSLKNIKQYQFIRKLKNSSLLSVRIRSNCGSVDYKFGLRGSTKALNFVLGKDWIKNKNKEHQELKIKDKIKLKEDSINNRLWHKKLEKKRIEKEEKVISFKNKQQSQSNVHLVNLEIKKKEADSLVNNSYIKFSKNNFYINKSDIKVYKNIYEVEEEFIIPRGTLIVVYDDYNHSKYFKLKYANEYYNVRRFFIEKHYLKKLF